MHIYEKNHWRIHYMIDLQNLKFYFNYNLCSFELLEEEVKPGYCTMLQVCKSMNFLETKSINDRVRKFNRQIATFNDATKAATNKRCVP